MRTASQHALAENDSVHYPRPPLYVSRHDDNKLRLKAYRDPYRKAPKAIYAMRLQLISRRNKTSRNVTNRLVDAILLVTVVHGSDSMVNTTQWTPATPIYRFSKSRVHGGDGEPQGTNLRIYDSAKFSCQHVAI